MNSPKLLSGAFLGSAFLLDDHLGEFVLHLSDGVVSDKTLLKILDGLFEDFNVLIVQVMSEVEEVGERTASAETVFTTISTCRLKKTIKGLEVHCATVDMGLQLFDDLFLGGEGVLGLRTLSALRRDHALMRNTYHLKLGTERVFSCGGRSSIFEAFLDASLDRKSVV